MNSPFTGISYLFKGLDLIFAANTKRFMLIPLLINATLFTIAILALFFNLSGVHEWLNSLLPDLGWFSFLNYLILPFMWLLFLLLGFLLVSVLANIAAAPFNPILAKAVESHLTGTPPPQSTLPASAEAIKAISSEAAKLAYFVLWSLLILLISFIPVINLIAPLAWFIFGAWMYSIEYSDFPLGNHGLSFNQIRHKLAEKRLLSLGFGAAVTLAMMIPLANLFIVPVAVAGATAMCVTEFPLQAQEQH